MEDINDQVGYTYAIRRRLAALHKAPGQNHYEYYVGKFKVNIWTTPIQEHGSIENDNISRHVILPTVDLYEVHRNDPTKRLYDMVYMSRDTRFMNYKPIQYPLNPGSPFAVTSCTGRNMPLENLCELIRYLHKLEKLSVFL